MDNNHEEDLDSHLQYLKEIQDPQQAIAILKEHQSKGTLTDALFFFYLELLIDQQAYDQALGLLTVQKCRELSDPESYLIRAKILSQMPRRTTSICDEVEYLCLEALRLDPRNLDAYSLLLEWYALVFHSSSKINFLFKLAQSSQIQQHDFYKEMLSALLMINEANEADQVYEILMELLSVREQPVLDFIRLLHLQLHQTGTARILWDWFRKRGSADHPKLYRKLIKICEQLNNDPLLWDQEIEQSIAISQWDKALKIKIEGIKDKIDVLLLHCCDRLAELDPSDAEILYYKGCLLYGKEPKLSLLFFQKALDISPDFIQAQFQRACLLREIGQHVEAFEAFQEILRAKIIHPQLFTEAFLQLSSLCLQSNKQDKAVYFLEQALCLAPVNEQLHFAMGKLYLEEYFLSCSENALNKAEEHLQKILTLAAESPGAVFYLGQIAYVKEQYLSSVKLFKDALKGLPANVSIYFWLSRALFSLHQHLQDASTEYLEEAVAYAEKIKPSSAYALLLLQYLKALYAEQNRKGSIALIEKQIESLHAEIAFKDILLQDIGEAGHTRCYLLDLSSKFSSFYSVDIRTHLVKGNEKVHLKGSVSTALKDAAQIAFMVVGKYLKQHAPEKLPKDKDLLIECLDDTSCMDGDSTAFSTAMSMLSACTQIPIPEDFAFIGALNSAGEILAVKGIGKKIELAISHKVTHMFIPSANDEEVLALLLEKKIKLKDEKKFPRIISVRYLSEAASILFDF